MLLYEQTPLTHGPRFNVELVNAVTGALDVFVRFVVDIGQKSAPAVFTTNVEAMRALARYQMLGVETGVDCVGPAGDLESQIRDAALLTPSVELCQFVGLGASHSITDPLSLVQQFNTGAVEPAPHFYVSPTP